MSERNLKVVELRGVEIVEIGGDVGVRYKGSKDQFNFDITYWLGTALLIPESTLADPHPVEPKNP